MKRFKQWRLKRRVLSTASLLVKVDSDMKKLGMPRYKRKQIWGDFVKSPERRLDIIQVLKGVKL